MYKVGQLNKIKVLRTTDFGYYLGDDDEQILLPNSQALVELKIGDEVEVFVYMDSEDRPIATQLTPKLMVGDIGPLKVVDVNSCGVFLDWGLSKDLLLPFAKQRRSYKVGEYVVVKLVYDSVSNRLIANAKFPMFYDPIRKTLKEDDAVELMVIDILDKGLQVLVNNCFLGLVYSSDVYDDYEVGAELNGYIKKIREDGKLDIVIKKQGFSVVSEDQEKILQELKKHNNFLPLTSKSSAEEVKSVLKMSRKAFKKAIGGLYKNKVVLIKDDGIYLK